MWLFNTPPNQQRRKTRFIYDNRWSNRPGCLDTVQSSWNVGVAGSRMYSFHGKLKNVRFGLLDWRKKSALIQINR